MKKYIIIFAIISFASTVQSAAATNFTIQKGWNLVSAQVFESLERKDGDVLDGLFQEGVGFFALSPVDKKYYGGSGSRDSVKQGIQKMFQGMSDGDDGVYSLGLWMYSPRQFEFAMNFDVPAGSEKNYQESYHPRRGWNLIGITGVMLGKSLTEVSGDCIYESAYHFEKGEWRKQSDMDLSEKLTLDSLGHSVAIKVMNDCVFDFRKGTAATQIPSLPR